MGWFRADVFGARVLFTDRHGGVSAPPYSSLNLTTGGDDPAESVVENRRRALGALGLSGTWVPMRQVHGAAVVDAGSIDGAAPAEADAVVVIDPKHVGAVLTADCAPVALVGPGGVAAVHAGWPGLLAGVVEASAEALRASGVEPRRALLGPCIRPCCYEFGEDKLADFEDRFGPAVRASTAQGTPALDIPAAAAAALRAAGVVHVSDLGICTSCSPAYFSYRRDGDPTGRQALLVGRRP
ncbi:MAG: laccase domain-containing protein [Actinobacteria bacterium]|nr:laccase domain-containing protein [Actinomycetota bacterium]